MNLENNDCIKKILMGNNPNTHNFINSLSFDNMNDLEKFFYTKPHRTIFKYTSYFEVYDRYFSKFRNTDVTIVEIGVFKGGSLQMWKDYFGPKARVIGIDVNPDCKAFEEEQIEVMIGSQSDPKFLEQLKDKITKIDILIDDGSHQMNDQKTTYEYLFPHISENGIYLCEDIHTSYWSIYGGGYKNPYSFIEYTKNFIDYLNAWYCIPSELPISYFTESSYSVAFYNSIVVVEKRKIDSTIAGMTIMSTTN